MQICCAVKSCATRSSSCGKILPLHVSLEVADNLLACWTVDPEVSYVLEYTPSKMSDSEIIKMAESAAPMEEKTEN